MIGSKIDGFYEKLTFRYYWYINITARIFFYLNSSINPILYNCLSKKFRSSFKKLLLFRICFPNEGRRQLRAQFSMNYSLNYNKRV